MTCYHSYSTDAIDGGAFTNDLGVFEDVRVQKAAVTMLGHMSTPHARTAPQLLLATPSRQAVQRHENSGGFWFYSIPLGAYHSTDILETNAAGGLR